MDLAVQLPEYRAGVRRVLLCVTASVAAIKMTELLNHLTKTDDVDVVLVYTKNALHFIPPTTFGLCHRCYTDVDEWRCWSVRSDPVLHIELRKWAQIGLIAPLSANTLAKLATGLADNLLTSMCRAWDWKKPMLVAPAMNTEMWTHPITAQQLESLNKWGAQVIHPVAKRLICGDTGIGAMESIEVLTRIVKEAIDKLD